MVVGSVGSFTTSIPLCWTVLPRASHFKLKVSHIRYFQSICSQGESSCCRKQHCLFWMKVLVKEGFCSDLPEDSCLVLKALLMFLQRLQYLAHLVSSHPMSIDSEHGFLSWCCCSGMCCLVFFFRPLESVFSQLQEWNCGVVLDESLELFTKHLVMYVFAELVMESLSLSAVASLLSRSLDETTQYELPCRRS